MIIDAGPNFVFGRILAYDFLVGIGCKVKDHPDIVGQLQFDELASIGRLSKLVNSSFLHRIANPFQDDLFTVEESQAAIAELLPLLTSQLDAVDRSVLQKLIAVLAYAQSKQQTLFGIAD